MQKIPDGNYFFLVEFLAKAGFRGSKQWEIASVSRGHIRWLNHGFGGISLKNILDNNTPFVKIPEPDKLQNLLSTYRENPLKKKK